jgi:serine O-acetyltransferase
MTRDTDFQADLDRYPTRPIVREQSIWRFGVYRFGRRVVRRRSGLLRTIQLYVYIGFYFGSSKLRQELAFR